MINVWLDIRYALRQLRKSPGFTFTVVLTLALGIGANAAVFTLFDQVLLRMLPVQQPKDLVRFEWAGGFSGSASSFGGDRDNYFSYPMYKDLRDQNRVFSGILAADRRAGWRELAQPGGEQGCRSCDRQLLSASWREACVWPLVHATGRYGEKTRIPLLCSATPIGERDSEDRPAR